MISFQFSRSSHILGAGESVLTLTPALLVILGGIGSFGGGGARANNENMLKKAVKKFSEKKQVGGGRGLRKVFGQMMD